MIQSDFAKMNGLNVGDCMPLSLYFANYANSASANFSRDSAGINFGFLNADGNHFPAFEEGEYRIVGIYTPTVSGNLEAQFMMAYNEVVIPNASVHNSDSNNILSFAPMKASNTSFEIPNGSVESYTRAWNKQGIGGLEIKFYDKGFSRVKDGLDLMRVISIILFTIGIAVMVLVLAFFTFIFILKNKKRMAIERSIGLEKRKIALSTISGMLVVAVPGITIRSVVGYKLCNYILKLPAVSGVYSTFDLNFSKWVNNSGRLPGRFSDLSIDLQAFDAHVFFIVALIIFVISLICFSIGIWRTMKIKLLTMLSDVENA